MNITMCDAVVVGAGIIGAACAYELTQAGLAVTVLEANQIACGATSAGMGHLVVLDDPEPQFALTSYSMQLWRDLVPLLPSQCEYFQCGTVWVAANEEELKLARCRCDYYNSHGVSAEMLGPRELAELEPNLRPGLAGGFFVPDDAAVHPASVVRFLLSEAQRLGAKVITGHHVKFLDGAGAYVINAAGTDAASLTPGLPVRSRKGHIVVLDAPSNFARHQVLELGYVKSTRAGEDDSVVFNVRQDENGEVLVGSSRQYQSENRDVEPAVVNRILSRAVEYMPALAVAQQVRSWIGFRAGTPDGLPLIGGCAGFERVYAATGHEGLGATTSLATARLIADEILRRSPAIDPDPYRTSRFSTQKM